MADQRLLPIRQGRFAEIDVECVAEELEDVGASKERELENRLGIFGWEQTIGDYWLEPD